MLPVHSATPDLKSYPAHLVEQWQTRDGVAVTLRPIRAEDADIEQDFVRKQSSETRYLRFMSHLNELSPEQLKRFTDIDYEREMALIAVRMPADGARGGGETQMAVARYVTDVGGKSCEFAVVVGDAWRRRGLGRKLMGKLMDCARASGIDTMHGEVLADNLPMLEMMRRLGFSIAPDPGDAKLRLVSRSLGPPA